MADKLVLKQQSALKLRFQPGATGPSGTVTVGTVTTGAPGSDVIITNSGTPNAAILNFTIPEGEQGIQGLTGNKGWSPAFAIVSDGARRVLQVDDWVGGEGTKPATGDYVGATGLTPTIGDAVDIRGPAGTATIPDGDKGDITTSAGGDTWLLNDGSVDDDKVAAGSKLSNRIEFTVTPEDYGATANDGTTDETTELAAAVQAALLAGLPLRMDRVYVADSNIPNLHDVKKVGSGAIIANGVTYPIEADFAEANNLYVATTGSDTNDGLSPSRPFATVAHAVDVMSGGARFAVLNGSWTINLAAGTYTEHSLQLPVIYSRNFITIKGPTKAHPLVPTCIFDGGGTAPFFFGTGSGTQYQFDSIKFYDYEGSAGAIVGQFGSYVWTRNVHCEAGAYGVRATFNGRLLVQGGIFKVLSANAIEAVSSTVGTVGYGAAQLPRITTVTMTTGAGQTTGTVADATGLVTGMYMVGNGIADDTTITVSGTTITLSEPTTSNWGTGDEVAFIFSNCGPVIFNCDGGPYYAEHSDIHTDYCAIFNCQRGISLLDSRSNLTGTQIKGNTTGIDGANADIVLTNGGEVSGNSTNFRMSPTGFLGVTRSGTDARAVTAPVRVAWDYVAATWTGSASSGALKSNVWTIPRHWFQGDDKQIHVKGRATLNPGGAASAGIVTAAVRIGSAILGGAQASPGTAADTQMFFELWIRPTSSTSQFFTVRNMVGSAPAEAAGPSMGDLSVSDQPIHIYGALTNAADTIRLDEVEVRIEGA